MEGWIKLHRCFLDWEWFNKPEMAKIFLYFLLKANCSCKQWEGISINIGQLVITREKVCSDLDISPQVFRTCIKRLISTNEITVKSTNKYTLITVCKYTDYQESKRINNQCNNQESNQQATNEQPTPNQQSTINKNKENIFTTPASAYAYEAEISLDSCFDCLMLNEAFWMEQFCMNNHLTPQMFADHLKSFFVDLQNRGETSKSVKDAKFHFANWFKQNKNKSNETDRKPTKADKTRNLVASIADECTINANCLSDDEVLRF